ncbi:MAG TPA: hypothetical protein VFL10_09290 [Ornithinibacter sp.]|nr:hypothetical protein [Ornithinibacter sp.]
MAEPTVIQGSVALLRPGDLKFAPGQSPPRRLRCRLVAVDLRRTQQGQSWAWLDLSWRGRTIRGGVFPRHWRALRSVPDLEVGHDYVVVGSIAFSEGTPVLNVLDIREQLLRLVPSD